MRLTIFGAGAVGGHRAACLEAHGPAAGIEVAAVARGARLETMNRHGITLWIGEEGTWAPIDPERAYGARPTSTHKSSMLQGFERDRPPEIDGLLTAVQAFARAAGIATLW